MATWHIIGIIGSLILLGLTVLGTAVRTTRALSVAEATIRKDFAATVQEERKDHAEKIDQVQREFGETVNAIRQHVHNLETWSRDEFVRKGSFEMVVGRLEKGIETMGDKIERRLDRMAERIEKIVHE